MDAATGAATTDAYHPGNERGFGPAAIRATYSIATDVGFDVVREFWPEIARKFKMPVPDRAEGDTGN